MTAPSTPTPATLDAAVEAAARAGYEDPATAGPGMWTWDDLLHEDREHWRAIARRQLAAAAPILAATHADQFAQAHAAGTAEGATAERERIAVAIESQRRPVEHESHDPHCVPCVVRRLTNQDDAAIARAGTSEVPS